MAVHRIMNTDIPSAAVSAPLSDERRNLLLNLESHLSASIRGQDHALSRIASVLRRGELDLSAHGRPKGSLLLLGPTGVGKTESVVAFTTCLSGGDKLFRFDMSEYQTQESLALLLGTPSGVTGMLGRVFERSTHGTLLFDEIEKANPRIMDVFLQILDAARVTLADGTTLDLSRYYVVLTSNIGSADLLDWQHSSFATMERHVLASARQWLRPELYARITEKLVFQRLAYGTQLEIARLMLDHQLNALAAKGHRLTASPDVLPFLVREGFHPKLGARPLRDCIEKLTGDAVAQRLLAEGVCKGILHASSDGLEMRLA
jgi:ATP-dependent Clp protease ATP-binding subunit ClpB